MLAVLAMGPDRPQNGPPLLKVSHGYNDFGADGLRGLMLAVSAFDLCSSLAKSSMARVIEANCKLYVVCMSFLQVGT